MVANPEDVVAGPEEPVQSGAVPSPSTHAPPATGRCVHCSLPVPKDAPNPRFCCPGCETVFGLLHSEGLDRFYDLGGGRGQPVGTAPRALEAPWLPELEALALRGLGDAASLVPGGTPIRLKLSIFGIRCAACVWAIQELWRREPGALDLRLDPGRGEATFCYVPAPRDGAPASGSTAEPDGDDPGVATPTLSMAGFLERLARLGYRATPPSEQPDGQDRGLLIRLGICSALAMNAMLLALSGYYGLDEEGGFLAGMFAWISAGIATLAAAVGGPVFFRGAFGGLRHKVLHLDLPITLGIVLATLGSWHGFLTSGSEGAYFDTVTVFVALMLGGRFVQERTLSRNRAALLRESGVEHLRVRRRTGIPRVAHGQGAASAGEAARDGAAGGSVEMVGIDSIRPGDTLILAPGDLVPVDVQLLSDCAAAFSLDWIQGEAEPVRFAQGAQVPAGAFAAGTSPVEAVAVRDAKASGLLSLLALPDPGGAAATEQALGLGRFWRQLNTIYVTAVLVAASLGAALWAWLDPSQIVPVTVAILVVTCPCALGLAVPLASHLAVAALRKSGVLVRTGNCLDKMLRVRHLVLDKTGTLTWGGLQVKRFTLAEGCVLDDAWTLAESSNHPASRAVAEALRGRIGVAGVPRWNGTLDIRERPGLGVEATSPSGTVHRLGRDSFVRGGDLPRTPVDPMPGDACAVVEEVAGDDSPEKGQGGEVVYGVDGAVLATFTLHEDFRPGEAEDLAALRDAGVVLHILSGDQPIKVQSAVDALRLSDCHAEGGLSPADKAERLGAIQAGSAGGALMVGDGINDAPAMDGALCAGTPALDRPALPGRVDFCYGGGTARAVRRLLQVAARLRGTVRLTLGAAVFYNAAALGLCFAGLMTPLWCAVLMPLSSVALLSLVGLRMGGQAARLPEEQLT